MGIASETYTQTFTVSSGNSVTLSQTPDKIIAVIRENAFITDYSLSGATVTINDGDEFGKYKSSEEIVIKYAVDT